MTRPRNPNGDPVAIRKKGDVYKVRYYPTGVITDPTERKELPGVFHTQAAAEAQAALLRERLIEHRDSHLPGTSRGYARLSSVLRDYLIEQKRAYESMALPLGTHRKLMSDMRLYVEPVATQLDVRIKDLPTQAARMICDGVTQSGNVENTITASQWSLGHFGSWLVTKGFLQENPFTPFIVSNPESIADKKKRKRSEANERATRETFEIAAQAGQGLGVEDVPTLEVVSALSDAMYRRESGKASMPNSRLLPLGDEVARQISAMPLLRTATGLRHCETLALHTSRVNLERLSIGVDRQLLRLPGWHLGPPKHNRIREAFVWPMFEARLRELVEWADANTDGWLFAPPRNDQWWTENCDDLWERAVDLMTVEHDEAVAKNLNSVPPKWTWFPHHTRHTYGSYSLAPQSSGGLGWSIRMVSQSMGHSNERTTEEIYRHAIGEERLTVRNASIDWPGLGG
jgi:integrase